MQFIRSPIESQPAETSHGKGDIAVIWILHGINKTNFALFLFLYFILLFFNRRVLTEERTGKPTFPHAACKLPPPPRKASQQVVGRERLHLRFLYSIFEEASPRRRRRWSWAPHLGLTGATVEWFPFPTWERMATFTGRCEREGKKKKG